MTITTSRKLTYTVDWIDSPLSSPETLLLEMTDPRPIAQIVPEFDGLTRIERKDANQGDKVFDGYAALVGISRQPKDKVRIILERA